MRLGLRIAHPDAAWLSAVGTFAIYLLTMAHDLTFYDSPELALVAHQLGVGHPTLEKLVDSCRPHSYGAKLTGAGGGGSMIALTDDPESVSKAIRDSGGEPIVVEVGCEGVRMEE